MDEETPTILDTKIKCSYIKDLFLQIVKSTKSSKEFYMNLHKDGIKMVFMESDKEVEIYVELDKQKFLSFNYFADNETIMKYDIRDLEPLGMIFENQNSTIGLVFKSDWLYLSNENEFTGSIKYRFMALEINGEIPEEVLRIEEFGTDEEENHTKILIDKVKKLTVTLHALAIQKIENFELNLESTSGEIEINPLPDMITSNRRSEDCKQIYRINVEFKTTQILKHFRFNLKKFKTCLNLFEKNSQIEIDFYNNLIKFEGMDKSKKNVRINLACLADI